VNKAAYCVGDASQAQHDKAGLERWLREPQPPRKLSHHKRINITSFIPLPEVLEGKRKRLSHQSNSRKKIRNMEHGITKLEQITLP
jgi:hypothetical protein